jgi:hypothetical protein
MPWQSSDTLALSMQQDNVIIYGRLKKNYFSGHSNLK